MNISQAGSIIALFSLLSCRQNREEPKAPGEFNRNRLQVDKNSQDATAGGESRISSAAEIRRDYLRASVLEENSTNGSRETRVGLRTYFNGKRTNDNPGRYKVSLSLTSAGTDSAITFSSQAANGAEFELIITLKGPSSDRIEKAYDDIRIFTSIVDTSDKSSVSLAPAISDVLTSTRSRSR